MEKIAQKLFNHKNMEGVMTAWTINTRLTSAKTDHPKFNQKVINPDITGIHNVVVIYHATDT